MFQINTTIQAKQIEAGMTIECWFGRAGVEETITGNGAIVVLDHFTGLTFGLSETEPVKVVGYFNL